jgi:tRNA (mo5U34)-methyltransferase
MTSFSKTELQQAVSSVPHWFHSIDLGQDVVTPGDKTADLLSKELASLRLPDLQGKTVLDIGAWDGFYSWSAERLGARRVVSVDHFVWALDRARALELAEQWRREGVAPTAYEKTDAWKPSELPGKRGYDLAHQVFNSRAECIVADFGEVDWQQLGGPFDVVLFLGVLYHMRHPLLALEKVAAATRGLAIIESEAMEIAEYSGLALCEFFERDELRADFSNWWSPNERALVAMCRAAGFDRVEVIQGFTKVSSMSLTRTLRDKLKRTGRNLLRELGLKSPPRPKRYRAIIHAWKR